MSKYLFTSESVTEGHPDKMCDQISDAVLDSALSQDKESRVACEVLTTTGLVLIAGEISTHAYIDIQGIARDTIKGIGYIDPKYGFDYLSCSVLSTIHSQSPDIAQGVDTGGAGDQGMMFGFACNETKELMPLPIMLSHRLVKRLATYRKENNSFLRPDGKAQITVEYTDNKPRRIDTIVLSTQHSPDVKYSQLKELICEEIINRSLPKDLLDNNTVYHINPTGKFVLGGPAADSGLTGRKIIVDTYGGYSRHGGGAFSGKDASKVDRSATYMARYLAKNIVASGCVDKCEIELAYAIGICDPVSIFIEDFNTSKLPKEKLVKIIQNNVDLSPKGIIERFSLKQPIFKKTAAYGHFGREEFPWEKLDLAEKFK